MVFACLHSNCLNISYILWIYFDLGEPGRKLQFQFWNVRSSRLHCLFIGQVGRKLFEMNPTCCKCFDWICSERSRCRQMREGSRVLVVSNLRILFFHVERTIITSRTIRPVNLNQKYTFAQRHFILFWQWPCREKLCKFINVQMSRVQTSTECGISTNWDHINFHWNIRKTER